MEEIPNIACKKYQDIRGHIRSGDILLCSGKSLFSSLIQKATSSIWSHVAFILRVDAIDRIMVLESVESIGVRAIPLSNYVRDYNATGKGYEGRLMIARHQDVKDEHITNLSRSAVDFLGYPYRTDEIIHIAARLGFHTLGFPHGTADSPHQRAFICSEYAHVCFQSIGVDVDYNAANFIAPADFARHPKIKPICFVETETLGAVDGRRYLISHLQKVGM